MIYVIRDTPSGRVAIGCSPHPTGVLEDLQGASSELLEIEAIFPGGAKEERAVRAALKIHRASDGWFHLQGYNVTQLVRAVLEHQSAPSGVCLTEVWRLRQETSETSRWGALSEGASLSLGPPDFFPPPTPDLEWAHERYFFPSRKERTFDVPDGEHLGDHVEGFRSTRRSP